MPRRLDLSGFPIPIPIADESPHPESRGPVLGIILLSAALTVLLRKWPPLATLAFIPGAGNPWGWFSSAFLELTPFHWLVNAWLLWLFGDNLAARLGRWFVPFYLAAAAAGNMAHRAATIGDSVPALGAAGAVAGVIAAYMVFFPRARLRCVSFASARGQGYGRGDTVRLGFSVSALHFGLLALAAFALAYAASRGTEFEPLIGAAPLGGAAFGALCALALCSGAGSGEIAAPAKRAAAGSGAAVEAAVREGREQEALAGYLEAARGDPEFLLAGPAQLWVADRLARQGHPHLARNAVERLLRTRPGGELSAHALLFLGWIEEARMKDFDAAARAFRAAAEATADPATRENARRRLAAAETLLKSVFLERPSGTHHAIVLESAEPPDEAQAAAVARELGWTPEAASRRLRESPGILVRGVATREAAEIAQRLEAAGVPVVLVDEDRLVELPEARLVAELSLLPDGVALKGGPALPPALRFDECLLVAAAGLALPSSAEAPRGLFEVGDVSVSGASGRLGPDPVYAHRSEPERRLEAAEIVVPVLELVTVAPHGRFRWTPAADLAVTPERMSAFFDLLQELLARAGGVPAERGARAAFERRFPPASIFRDRASWAAHLLWQAQLAALKRRGAYR